MIRSIRSYVIFQFLHGESPLNRQISKTVLFFYMYPFYILASGKIIILKYAAGDQLTPSHASRYRPINASIAKLIGLASSMLQSKVYGCYKQTLMQVYKDNLADISVSTLLYDPS